MTPSPDSVYRPRQLLSALADVGPLRVNRVKLPGTDVSLQVARPTDFDRLLDAAAEDPEQNLPYWAEVWPSGIALAAAIAREPATLAGKRVLELGCGLGVTAIAALRAGADLLVTDYSPEALALCALNALDQLGREPDALQINWRAPGPELFQATGDGFPLVLAADVLYEDRDVAPLLTLMERIVAPGGELWLAAPDRRAADQFVAAMHAAGWQGGSERMAGPWSDVIDDRKRVVVTIHRLRRPLT